MNAFDATRMVEAQALVILKPYLREISDGLVLTNKGVLSKWLQESGGDVLMEQKEILYAIELKAEQRHTGNLFLEIWSNRNLESIESHAERGQSVGWLMKTRADWLLYYFLDADKLYAVRVFNLKRWAFGSGDRLGMWGSGRLKECVQRRYTQLNDTWGILAPVEQLRNELPKSGFLFTTVRQRQVEPSKALHDA